MSNIVIVGFNFAGNIAAQTIFKEIEKSSDKSKYTVTVVSASDKFYFNPAAPRLLVEPELIDKAFFPIEPYLKKIAKDIKYEFVHGTVDHADFETQTLMVTRADGVSKSVAYGNLILASGSRTQNSSLKLDGDSNKSYAAITDLSKEIKNATSIAVLGGGSTGVETASEIAYSYPKKQVTLYTGSAGPLDFIGKSAQATKRLEKLGIKVVNHTRYTSIDQSGKTTTINFDDGSSVNYDLYVPTFGVVPNTSFIDNKYLDKQGYVIVDDHLRVKNHPEIIALGDVASGTGKSIGDMKFGQQKPFTASVKKEIFKENVTLTKYEIVKNTILVPISREGGVGVIFGYSFPSFLIKLLKGKDFMLGKAGDDFS